MCYVAIVLKLCLSLKNRYIFLSVFHFLPPVQRHTSLTHASLTFCKVTLPVYLGCHMINGPRGTGVAWNTVTFALLASSEPKVAGRSWWQCLPVLGHLCRHMRVYVCVHLEWIITPLDASASAKWEDRSACAFMSKTSRKLVAVRVRCFCYYHIWELFNTRATVRKSWLSSSGSPFRSVPEGLVIVITAV